MKKILLFILLSLFIHQAITINQSIRKHQHKNKITNLVDKIEEKYDDQGEQIVGGWQNIDIKKDDSQAFNIALSFAKDNYKEQCPKKTEIGEWSCNNLVGAEEQVVAGINFRIVLECELYKESKRNIEITVWMHPMNSQTGETQLEITDCQWLMCC